MQGLGQIAVAVAQNSQPCVYHTSVGLLSCILLLHTFIPKHLFCFHTLDALRLVTINTIIMNTSQNTCKVIGFIVTCSQVHPCWFRRPIWLHSWHFYTLTIEKWEKRDTDHKIHLSSPNLHATKKILQGQMYKIKATSNIPTNAERRFLLKEHIIFFINPFSFAGI